jgi:hypothetical protein
VEIVGPIDLGVGYVDNFLIKHVGKSIEAKVEWNISIGK